MIVVSDTSGLSVLITVGRENLLPKLFQKVIIPEAVRRELESYHPKLPVWLECREVAKGKDKAPGHLGEGEWEAILLAEQARADLLLMDEKPGRRIAEGRGLQVIGVLGVLVQAKRQGLISELKPLLQEVVSAAGFFLSPALFQAALRSVNEKH
ncbi:MAG: DUF3368 domain-containing protein [Verrucomicrobia bacterium]|nr:DUF3368 domain-containing protein [Verrucomicrobiota bacterium]